MPFVSALDAPLFELPGVRFRGLASPTRGAAENSVWTVTLEPGTPARPHQLTREQIFVVLEGRAEARVGVSPCHALEPGCALIVPAHTTLSLSNPFESPFVAVAVLPVGGQAIVGEGPPFTPPWAA